jgi:predicted dienelactone hydrolase
MLRAAFTFILLWAPLGLSHAAPVDVVLGEWTDGARSNRVVPYKIYLPANAAGAHPVILFSHGFGGNRDAGEYLLRFLAENGYAAVAVQHAGTDTPAVFGDGPLDRAQILEKVRTLSPAAIVDRFRDIPFAIDELIRMNANDARFRGRFDIARIGMSGHSAGALTALVIAGQSAGPGGRISFADPRVKAALAMSPNKPREGDPAQAFAAIRIPTFHMTGTEDRWPTDENVDNRKVPYRNIAAADKFLLVFAGGDHGLFGGRRAMSAPQPTDDAYHALIQKAALAYWDAYLREDKHAKAYLTGGKFAQDLGDAGTFEYQLR